MSYLYVAFIAFTTSCYAQITTRRVATEAPKVETAVFDSTLNFVGSSPILYKGQDLYLKERPESLRKYGYEGFLTDYNKFKLDKGAVYECCESFNTKYDVLKGKYFTVMDVIRHPKAESSLYKDTSYLKLKRKDNGDELYFEYDAKYDFKFPFIVVGFFDKQKKSVVGQSFVFCNECIKSSTDINTGKPITQIPGAKWKCIDLTIEEKYYQLSLICQNEKGEQITMPHESAFGKYRAGRVYNEKEVIDYTKRFGAENFARVLDGKVKIGMTKEMCRLSWGEPKDINKTISVNGSSEQWVYSSNYLYFDGDRLTTMQ